MIPFSFNRCCSKHLTGVETPNRPCPKIDLSRLDLIYLFAEREQNWDTALIPSQTTARRWVQPGIESGFKKQYSFGSMSPEVPELFTLGRNSFPGVSMVVGSLIASAGILSTPLIFWTLLDMAALFIIEIFLICSTLGW